jgi:hypothetical protein
MTAIASTTATTSTTPIALPLASATAPVAPTPVQTPDERSGKAHGAHGGHGHFRQTLTQALEGLGLTASGSAKGEIKHDTAQFMHALFQAVAAEAAPSAPAGGSRNEPKANFAAGLAALITEASNGTAPAALQAAFDKLAAALKPAPVAPVAATEPVIAPVETAPVETPVPLPAPVDPVVVDAEAVTAAATPSIAESTTTTPTTAPPPAAPTFTLLALLSRLQQGLGYGDTGTTSSVAIGNTLSVMA